MLIARNSIDGYRNRLQESIKYSFALFIQLLCITNQEVDAMAIGDYQAVAA